LNGNTFVQTPDQLLTARGGGSDGAPAAGPASNPSPATNGNFWLRTWSQLFAELSRQELGWLVSPAEHISLLSVRRAGMIGSRVLLIASLLAVLTPLWIIVDMLTLPWPAWLGLAVGRMFATLGFMALVIAYERPESMGQVQRSLAVLIGIPILFYVFSYFFLHRYPLTGLQEAVLAGYDFLPFVLVAGLAIFPLTLVENAAFVAAVFLVQLTAGLSRWPAIDPISFAVQFGLLAIIAGVGMLAGLSQLAFMIALVRDAIRDRLTGAFSRHSGEELLELQFTLSSRAETPLTVAFIDLDRFKRINDEFGHEVGDEVLVEATRRLRATLRTGDVLARWGGEEFVLIMPNTQGEQAAAALERVRAGGLGTRPDGQPVTASFGIAERLQDGASNWRELVDIADRRMYEAKRGGRNRIVSGRS
jgi:diguanylate cyclase (GGDEF)-like protein